MKSTRSKTRAQAKKNRPLLTQNPIPESLENRNPNIFREQVTNNITGRIPELNLDPGSASGTGFQIDLNMAGGVDLDSDQETASSRGFPSDSEQTEAEGGNSKTPFSCRNLSDHSRKTASDPHPTISNKGPSQHRFAENVTASSCERNNPLTREHFAGPAANHPHAHQLAKARKILVEIDIFSKKVEEVVPAVNAAMQAPPGIPIREKLGNIREFKESLEFRLKKYNDAYQIFQGMAQISESANQLLDDNQREHEERITDAEEVLYKADKRIQELEQGLREQAEAKNREFEIALRSEKQKSELERAERADEWKREMDTKQLQSENDFKERQLKYEQDLRTLRLEFEGINASRTSKLDNTESGHSSQSTVKLPKIELPKFSGNKLRWREFWEMFENGIHSKPGLPAIDKFNYLKSNLGGEALRIVTGLRLSGENYEIAIKQLKDRYGDTQHIIETHYSKLTNMPSVTIKTQDLRFFMDQFELHLNSLSALGENIENSQMMALLRSKLPYAVLADLERKKGKEEWTFSQFRAELIAYVDAQEKARSVLNVGSNFSRYDNSSMGW